MKFIFTLLLSFFSVVIASGASFPYITLNSKTNRLSDNGTNLTYNGSVLSGSTGTAGTLITNGASVSSGDLVAYGSTITNTAKATLANITNAMGIFTGSTTTFLNGSGALSTPTPASAANWTASGTTNSSLAGNATLNALTATNASTMAALSVTSFTNSARTASRVVFSASDKSDASSAASSVLLNSLTDPTGTGACVFGTAPTVSSLVVQTSLTITNAGSSTMAVLSPPAANTLQIGNNGGAPTAQTIKAADGSGTDKTGAILGLKGGQSTGTAAGGPVIISTSQTSTTGSTPNAYTERFHAQAKFVDLTESTATKLFTIPVTATNYVGLTATVTVYAGDGTDFQSQSNVITVDAVAKTTTITTSISTVANTQAASSGTLTSTFTAVDDGSNVMSIKCNAVSSLTQTVLRAKVVVTAINSSGTAAITEQ